MILMHVAMMFMDADGFSYDVDSMLMGVEMMNFDGLMLVDVDVMLMDVDWC